VRTVVLGYHNVGWTCLRVLLDAGEEVAAVYTHHDDPEETIWFGSVADLAASRGIPVHRPTDINQPHHVEQLRAYRPDILFSFYYRKLVSREILEIPRLGAFNMHGSLLPHYRGRCPVNWVLVRGESQTGVTLHHMVERADAGDIVAQWRIPITLQDTARSLHERIATAAAGLLQETLPDLRQGRIARTPQDLRAGSCFPGRRPADGRIDWARPAREVHDLVRAVTHPYPGAFTFLLGTRLFVWETRPGDSTAAGTNVPGRLRPGPGLQVETASGLLHVLRCQLDGQLEMDAASFLERNRLTEPVLLGGAK
jgi:methionyl-tRNA formyltransferase